MYVRPTTVDLGGTSAAAHIVVDQGDAECRCRRLATGWRLLAMLVKGSLFLLALHRSGWRWQHVPLHHAIASRTCLRTYSTIRYSMTYSNETEKASAERRMMGLHALTVRTEEAKRAHGGRKEDASNNAMLQR